MEPRKKRVEIFELIYQVISNDPQSIGKIAQKTGLNWRTVKEYIELIEEIQAKPKVRISKDPTQIWFVEE